MSFENVLALFIFAGLVIALVVIINDYFKKCDKVDYLDLTIHRQGDAILDQWMKIEDLEAENLKLKAKVSLLKLELEDKENVQ